MIRPDSKSPGSGPLKSNQRENTALTNTTMLGLIPVLGAIIWAFGDTYLSIITIWSSTEVYAHGFIILPLCLYLIYIRGRSNEGIPIDTSFLGVLLIAALSGVWWFAENFGIQTAKHLAAVAIVPAALFALLGPRFVVEHRFALAFLVFAVPFGDFFIPELVDFTAKYTVGMLRLFDIPVYRDGRYFHIPSGSFEVAKACAGLKYVIVTLAMTTLYSHFLSLSFGTSAVLVGAGLAIAIVANAIRATSIVLILHYTSFDISAGQDHAFVGWIVYAIVALAIGWLGLKLQYRFLSVRTLSDRDFSLSMGTGPRRNRVGVILPLAIAAILVGPGLSNLSSQQNSQILATDLRLPIADSEWNRISFNRNSWEPDFHGYSRMISASYLRQTERVDVSVVSYDDNKQGIELANAINRLADPDKWLIGNVETIYGPVDVSGTRPILATVIRRHDSSILVWQWNLVAGEHVISELGIKISEIRTRIMRRPIQSTAIFVSTPILKTEFESNDLLADFLQANYWRLYHCIQSKQLSPDCAPSVLGRKS